jgi:hypothetical protein
MRQRLVKVKQTHTKATHTKATHTKATHTKATQRALLKAPKSAHAPLKTQKRAPFQRLRGRAPNTKTKLIKSNLRRHTPQLQRHLTSRQATQELKKQARAQLKVSAVGAQGSRAKSEESDAPKRLPSSRASQEAQLFFSSTFLESAKTPAMSVRSEGMIIELLV